MNYLAHIYLSGKDSQVQIGNFIGDFVKGSQYESYPKRIQKGILLHRKIDHFTDSHAIVRETVALLRPAFGRYSAIVLDMYFDFILATKFKQYTGKSLNLLAYRFYFFSLINYRFLPQKVRNFIFHFISTNRLKRYKSVDGLKNSLEIMSRHKTPAIHPEKAIEFLLKNQDELELRFSLFFSELRTFVSIEILK